ncbi:hypothetical protein CFP56_001131 [Quercus suber]|uniref:Uncharacterized protein n=1 Tax=Quercus suber TaxID=58331 RepID=A0AAW0INJ9_QUESU
MEAGPSFDQRFTLINSIIQSPSMAPTNDYGEEIEQSKGKSLKNKKENSTLQSIQQFRLPLSNIVKKSKGKDREKVTSSLYFIAAVSLTPTPIVPRVHDPLAFSSKNSKDSFHIFICSVLLIKTCNEGKRRRYRQPFMITCYSAQ